MLTISQWRILMNSGLDEPHEFSEDKFGGDHRLIETPPPEKPRFKRFNEWRKEREQGQGTSEEE